MSEVMSRVLSIPEPCAVDPSEAEAEFIYRAGNYARSYPISAHSLRLKLAGRFKGKAGDFLWEADPADLERLIRACPRFEVQERPRRNGIHQPAGHRARPRCAACQRALDNVLERWEIVVKEAN